MTLPDGATNYTLPDGRDQPLAEETPVALVFDGVTQAVMMATPCDFHDFLIGFALTEGVISAASELTDLEVVRHDQGVEVRGWLHQGAGEVFRRRRRAMTGPVGCGLCGIDSLEQALRPLAHTRGGARLHTVDVATQALDALRSGQALKDATRATHAAAFWTEADGVVALREDVGRHNALDKLAGALANAGVDPAVGVVVMTSRLSVDLVQKTVMMGAGAIVAPSSPTALAIREAQAAGLVVYARAEGGMARYTG